MSAEQLIAESKAVNVEPYAQTEADESPELRRKTLTRLRTMGEEPARLADILTASFPADTRALPVKVLEAKTEGRDVWAIIEVWGSAGGKLDKRRLWVIDRATGAIVSSTTLP